MFVTSDQGAQMALTAVSTYAWENSRSVSTKLFLADAQITDRQLMMMCPKCTKLIISGPCHRQPPMALPDPFSCVAECRANIDSCNALIFDR